MNDVAPATNAGIATSDPRATEAGAQVLCNGGTCVDAAVAAALVLFVVEPHYCGPGGDAFLTLQRPGSNTPEALDGAGAIPTGLTPEALAADGFARIPPFGACSVTVPGAPALLATAVERYGRKSLAELTAPAVALASEGFTVRPTLATACARAANRIAADDVLAAIFLRGDQPIGLDETVTNPALASFLNQLGDGGIDAMYRGEIASQIVERVDSLGGYLTKADLAAHRTLDMKPSSTDFAGATVWQLPEPTQGPAVLLALDRLGALDAETTEDERWEAMARFIIEGLLSVGVDLVAAPWMTRQPGTSHIAVADPEGGVASLITSVFAPFGSAVGIAELGSPLQNRAAGFLLLDTPPSQGKPPHTIIPGLITRDGAPEAALGVAGGLMQVQGQVQLLVRLLERNEEPSAAIAAPRFRVVEGGNFAIEPAHPLAEQHPGGLDTAPGDGGFGCGQLVSTRTGAVIAAADHRRNGAAKAMTLPTNGPATNS